MADNLIKLSILENIEPGQKLSFYYGDITVVNKVSRISRWISGNNKDVTLSEISKIIDIAMICNTPIDQKVVTSLENMKVTYQTSKSMVKSLSDLQEKIIKYMTNT